MKKNKIISFEKALEELESISNSFEKNELSLDELISSFERGSELSDYCLSKLNTAKVKIEKIMS